MALDYLKAVFGDKQLSFDEFSKAIEENKEIKLANLSEGKYVDKNKFDDKVSELGTANKTITDLQVVVKKFDGVDVEALNKQIADLNDKYNTDTATMKLNSALDMALITAKAKNPKLAKAALDMSKISLDGDNLVGLTEQLDGLKQTDGYLFDTTAQTPPAHVDSGAGHGDNGGAKTYTADELKTMSADEINQNWDSIKSSLKN